MTWSGGHRHREVPGARRGPGGRAIVTATATGAQSIAAAPHPSAAGEMRGAAGVATAGGAKETAGGAKETAAGAKRTAGAPA